MKKLMIISLVLFILSCKSENINNSSSSSPGVIQVGVSEISFESEGVLGNRAATFEENTVQRNTIELNDDFLMVAELQPDQAASGALKDISKAALDTSALGANIHYRLLVYNQAGAFVTERDYIHGQESSTQALELDGGSTYTFVAVSLNTTTNLPATTPTATANRTLANSQITTPTGASALMYYQRTMTVAGNTTNRLDIVLKHRKPEITVTVNSSQTGYNITAINARISPHNDGLLVNLSNGSYTQNGTNVTRIVTFSSLGTQSVVSNPTSFNSVSNNNTSFTLLNITIGPLTLTNLTPFTTLNASPGVRYNLILNIVPRDEYLTHESIPAARINGRIWALHNLGVDNTLDHNPAVITAALHGNYYQFGRIAITAAPTANTTNSNFSTAIPTVTAWNLGTELAVSKNPTNDPCPNGFRLPTRTNMQTLIDGTVITRRGSFADGNTSFGSAAVLTSRRNANVALVLPAQGFHNVTVPANTPTGIENRGSTLNYWTSSITADRQITRLQITSSAVTIGIPGSTLGYSQSRPIRCTATLATQNIPQS